MMRGESEVADHYAPNIVSHIGINQTGARQQSAWVKSLYSPTQAYVSSIDFSPIDNAQLAFGDYDGCVGIWDVESGEVEKTIIPMRLQPIYQEDRIGLRALDERGAVVLKACTGEHMEISTSCWRPLVRKYVGGSLARPLSYTSVLRVQ